MVTWGDYYNNSGGLSSAVAAQLDGTVDVIQIFSTSQAFAALRADGSVVTWGFPDYGGDSSSIASLLASGVVSGANIYTNDVFSGNNDAPAGTDKTLTLLEDASVTLKTADFGFTDPNDSPANTLLAVKITMLPTAGSLKLNGVAVTTGQTISATDIAANKLTFTPAANANGANQARLTFQVKDNGGTANGGVDLDATANTLTFNVTAVNDAPTGTDKAATLLEDGSVTLVTADFGFADATDNGANTLLAVKIASLPGAGSLKLNNVAVTAGQVVTAADIAAGLLKFAPAANGNGAAYTALTFQVQDNGGTANGGVDLDQSPNTLTFNVTAVNDAPSGTSKTINANVATAYSFTAADFGFADATDNGAHTLLAVKISSLPTAGALKLNNVAVTAGQVVSAADIVAGKLAFTPAANSGASFTFQVQDNGGTANGGVDLDATPNTLTLNVSDSIAPTVITFSPADGLTGVANSSNIVLTFSEAIARGVGSLVLKDAAGAVVETFNAASSTRLTLSGSTLTVDPTNVLDNATQYFLVIPAGAVKDLAGNAYAGTSTYDFTTAVNVINGTAGDDDGLIGTALKDSIVGLAGDDFLVGLAGDDVLDGGTGDDLMAGGKGNDSYVVDSLADVVVEQANQGTDTVQSSVSYTLGAHVENLTLTGADPISGSGNSLNNVLIGNSANNGLDGGAGVDTLDGGIGADNMTGGDGNDTYYVDNVGDVVTETNAVLATGGSDSVYSSLGAYTLGANVENLRIFSAGAANGTGNALNNVIWAGAGNNVMDGGAGNDLVSYAYATVGVTVSLAVITAQATGGSGSDTLLNIESLSGSGFNDSLSGNGGDNILSGNSGNDVLTGAGGKDGLTGSAGADTFNYTAVTDSGITAALRDVIRDFSRVQGDKIDLSALDANSVTAGNQAFSAFTQGAVFSGSFAAQASLFFDQTAKVLYGNNDTDAQADFAIELVGVSSLALTDFVA